MSDAIALGLLKGEYAEGDVIVVDASPDGALVFTAQNELASTDHV